MKKQTQPGKAGPVTRQELLVTRRGDQARPARTMTNPPLSAPASLLAADWYWGDISKEVRDERGGGQVGRRLFIA